MDIQPLLDAILADGGKLAVTILSAVIAFAILYLLNVVRVQELYRTYEREIGILLDVLPDVFWRIAYADEDDVELQEALLEYTRISKDREEAGLSFIDPRLLYAIDRAELALPKNRRVDFNIIIDRAETLYNRMKQEGKFSNRTYNDLPALD